MKLPEQHIVPLAIQAVAILRELEPTTRSGRHVFPCMRGEDRPLSQNAITAALRRMGYTGDQMTWHGFRSLASTQLNEQGFESDWIETQLAHSERNFLARHSSTGPEADQDSPPTFVLHRDCYCQRRSIGSQRCAGAHRLEQVIP